jgi:hypothetical protein
MSFFQKKKKKKKNLGGGGELCLKIPVGLSRIKNLPRLSIYIVDKKGKRS